ncbi:hypothetical protein C5167_043993 [Papaver somniferum]|uniref:Uncharacterized protein n=1 Tax=Papaver somniferum TaxID=3469 RepID=A0A4Y7L9R3_PAPSO|nr:hypothetical protein C5167_043993 [Papaver somniferum]
MGSLADYNIVVEVMIVFEGGGGIQSLVQVLQFMPKITTGSEDGSMRVKGIVEKIRAVIEVGRNDKIRAFIEVGACRRLVELLLHPSLNVPIPALHTVVTGNDCQTVVS